MNWHPWSLLGCTAVLLTFLNGSQAHNPGDNPEYYVFRGDSRSPEEIRNAGGFLPNPDSTRYDDPRTFSLHHHVHSLSGSSAYVATSTAFGQSARNFAGVGSYVYRIHMTPNMINVSEALPNNMFPRQEEASALGGIPWNAVEGWLLLEEDDELQSTDIFSLSDDDSAARLTARYEAEFAHQFVPSGQYDDRGLGALATQTGADPEVGVLAARNLDLEQLQNAATTFMNRHATVIGWTKNQSFPYTPALSPAANERVDLQDADVSNISHVEMEDLSEHRFDNLNCLQLARSIGFTILPPKGPSMKRSISSVARIVLNALEKNAQCEQVRDFVRRVTFHRSEPPRSAKIVFYGDFLWPEEAKKMGGFLPPRTIPPVPAYQMEGSEVDTVRVDWATEILQTHLLFGTAAKDAAAKASKATKGFHGVVYAVHATPNMLLSGKDCVAVGGIRWSQVLGWVQIPLNYTPPEKDPKERKNLRQLFENAFNETTGLFQKNEDYDARFNNYTTTRQIPDLSTPQALMDFMDKHGKEVGWTGGFPLFDAQHITGAASKAAKEANIVAPPHEQGFWEEAGHFMETHTLALAMLPFVIAANLIPGVGEMADAAEMAALSTETVDGIELAEASSEGSSELSWLLAKVKGD